MFAEVVVPGSTEPVVELVGEISSEAIVVAADPEPQPAGPGSWPPSDHPAHIQLGGLWSVSKAKPKSKSKSSNDVEIF
jgi:hypothetical protein